MRVWKFITFALLIPLFLSAKTSMTSMTPLQSPGPVGAADCSFFLDPSDFLLTPEARWSGINAVTETVAGPRRLIYAASAADATPIPRKTLIDDHIFGRMERDAVPPAPIAGDQEFLRRVTLDLTGRIPSAEQVRQFVSDPNPAKRDALIDSLIGSEAFVDKWTMFFGDLFRNTAQAANVNRYFQGRDAFYSYLREAIQLNKPYNQIGVEIISANGDSFIEGETNFLIGGTVPMGPPQDTFDGQAVEVARAFLGINTADCVLCHDGQSHLENVNLWASGQKRLDMWGLSAFFARTQMRPLRTAEPTNTPSRVVQETRNGEYMLNTTIGNRSPRQPQGIINSIAPRFPLNGEGVPPGADRRNVLAHIVTYQPQFSRAAVNYIWEELMGVAFVSPSNGFDLARLDPNNPPPAPWTLQPTNPELLNELGVWFQFTVDFNLRSLIGMIAKSSAYQLSSAYPGEWKLEYVPYYARKFARRLDAEEVHDAVVQATGIPATYSLAYRDATSPLPPISWAMKLPDTTEPRANRQAMLFLDAFDRGDRDQVPRSSTGSPTQALNLMNSEFVMRRIHVGNAGSLVERLVRQTTDPAAIVEGLFLATLSRFPDPAEIPVALDIMRRLGNERGAESLQWALLNKLDFIHNY